MNKPEKVTAILERLGKKGIDIDGGHLSAMVITSYLDDLSKLGLIESAWTILPSGHTLKAVCEEFDWKPDNDELKTFVLRMLNCLSKPHSYIYSVDGVMTERVSRKNFKRLKKWEVSSYL